MDSRTALVLGGGGSAGNAWLIGVIAGLCEAGVDVTEADLLVGDSRYIDGGYRRNENADLAAGYGRVLVLSPLGGRTRHPLTWDMQLAAQVEELRTAGSTVEAILPDNDSLDAFGTNLMDPSTRAPAATAGCEQGRALGEHLAGFWR
jgi:NTE family protein